MEGGAPYLHEKGVPQYPPDAYDSDATYPFASTPPSSTGDTSIGQVEPIDAVETTAASSVPATSRDITSSSSSVCEIEALHAAWRIERAWIAYAAQHLEGSASAELDVY